MTPAISVEKINKHYGTFKAVQDLSFEVQRGELFALLGPNGSGKTTTIRMILDILKPDSGRIAVFGGALTQAAKDKIGYLPEERGLYRDVPVIEMMVYLGTLKGLPQQEAQKRSMALLEKLQLHESAKKKVSELSKGMQQKVQFAVTILHQPDLIIIDEPFSGLDPVNALALQEMIYDLKRQGVTIVMSTHQMYQVEEMAERLLMLHKGQLQLYGGVQEIRQRYALHAVNVDGEGDWAALQGVASVHRLGNSENGTGKSGYQLQLHPDVQTSEVLAAITRTPNMHLQRFELAVPSLNDIFIRVVENANEKASVV